jgi:hypothetical protein
VEELQQCSLDALLHEQMNHIDTKAICRHLCQHFALPSMSLIFLRFAHSILSIKIKALKLFGMVQNSIRTERNLIPLSTVLDKFEDQYSIVRTSRILYLSWPMVISNSVNEFFVAV